MVTIDTSWTEIEVLVDEAIAELRSKDALLFQIRVHERSLAHRLATYLEWRFTGWIADLEYNRIGNEGAIKRLMGLLNAPESEVYPDIIIHHRGDNSPNDNLLVIEIKTTWSRDDETKDIAKLKAFTGISAVPQLMRYKFGLFLKFDNQGAVIDRRKLPI